MHYCLNAKIKQIKTVLIPSDLALNFLCLASVFIN